MPRANRPAAGNRLLAALPRDDVARFFAALQPVPLAFRQVLHEVGAPLEHVYFIEHGIASVLTVIGDAGMSEVGMVGVDGMVGVAALLGAEVSAQRVIVQVPGAALRMDAAACKKAFDQSASVRAVVLRFVDAMLNLSAQTAACNQFHSIEQRCARWLLMTHDRLQSDVMPVTHKFLSSMLGVRRAGVTEIAGEFQRAGLIRYHHGEVTIVDREGIEAVACPCWPIDHDRLQRFLRGKRAQSRDRPASSSRH